MTCEVCGAISDFVCSKCGQAFYCSREHQREDWKRHKQRCSADAAAASGAAEWAARASELRVAAPASPPERSPRRGLPPEGARAESSSPRRAVDSLQPASPQRVWVPASRSRAQLQTASALQAASADAERAAPGADAATARAGSGRCARLASGLCLCLGPDASGRLQALAEPHPWLCSATSRVQAVDPWALAWPQLVGVGLVSAEAELEAQRAERCGEMAAGKPGLGLRGTHLTLDACGVALTHRRAWRALLDSAAASWALLLEDDVTRVCDGFDDALAAVLRALPAGWHICYLGFDTGADPPQDGARFCGGPLIHLQGSDGWPQGLWGYLLSRDGAELLLEGVFPLLARVDAAVGCLAALGGRGYAVPPGQFLLGRPPAGDSRGRDPG